MLAEEIEMIEDVYQRTGSAESRRMISETITGFARRFGPDWTTNKFNDDLIWMTIACARGCQATGNQAFCDLATHNYHAVWQRGWDNELGGGIWWTTDRTCKNACINGPAAIAACLLYQITGERSYLTNAIDLYAWERGALFDGAIGAVHDNVNIHRRVAEKVFTYNQGTFIGAANFLGQMTGNRQYLEEAERAADYTRTHLCVQGILPAYGPGDAAGFNGIFIRWLGRFAGDNRLWPKYRDWMLRNAKAAWDGRNRDNLCWQKWNEPTPDGPLDSWNCSDAVVILQVAPPPGS